MKAMHIQSHQNRTSKKFLPIYGGLWCWRESETYRLETFRHLNFVESAINTRSGWQCFGRSHEKVVRLNDYSCMRLQRWVFFDDCAMILMWIALRSSLEDDILDWKLHQSVYWTTVYSIELRFGSTSNLALNYTFYRKSRKLESGVNTMRAS